MEGWIVEDVIVDVFVFVLFSVMIGFLFVVWLFGLLDVV